MKRETIIQILRIYTTSPESTREKIADAIIKHQKIDMPTDEEIEKEIHEWHSETYFDEKTGCGTQWSYFFSDEEQIAFTKGARWIRTKIENRNK